MKAIGPVIFLLISVLTFGKSAHIKQTRDENRHCDYCHFYGKTGLSPYELLWTVAAEVSPVLDEDDRSPMMMNPEDLRIAERHFDIYCEERCSDSDIE